MIHSPELASATSDKGLPAVGIGFIIPLAITNIRTNRNSEWIRYAVLLFEMTYCYLVVVISGQIFKPIRICMIFRWVPPLYEPLSVRQSVCVSKKLRVSLSPTDDWDTGSQGHRVTRTLGQWDTGTLGQWDTGTPGGVGVPIYHNRIVIFFLIFLQLIKLKRNVWHHPLLEISL